MTDVPEPAEEEAHAEDEEQVREDGAEHRGLDDLDLAVVKRNDADLYRGCVSGCSTLARSGA